MSEISPNLSDFCTQLTEISQDTIDTFGVTFDCAFAAYHAWLTKKIGNSPNVDNIMFVTCGDWDLGTMLPMQTKLIPEYMTQWVNIKKILRVHCPGIKTGSLPEMLDWFGSKFQGRFHSGIDDCRNIVTLCRLIVRDGGVLRYTHSAPL